MRAVVAAELVLAVLVVLLVGALIFVWVRRRLISGDGRPVMLCALRDESSSRWRLGLARLGAQRFEWFSIVGPSLRPEVSWLRGEFDLGIPMPLADPIPGLAEPVSVTRPRPVRSRLPLPRRAPANGAGKAVGPAIRT